MTRCRSVPPDTPSVGLLSQVEAIYLASFPAEEREPFETILHDVRGRRATLYVAEDHGEVEGFGLTIPLRMRTTVYLPYLAVRGDLRGQGVGARLFRDILTEPARRGGPTALLWEVERPDDAAPPDDAKQRRIAFYRRQGGVLLEVVQDFRMPKTTGSGTIPAYLMWASAVTRPPLSPAEVRQCVLELFRVGYGRGLDDPLVRNVLASIRPGG